MRELGKKYGIGRWDKAASLFEQSGRLITDVCRAAMAQEKKKISGLMLKVADIEEEAYKLLEE